MSSTKEKLTVRIDKDLCKKIRVIANEISEFTDAPAVSLTVEDAIKQYVNEYLFSKFKAGERNFQFHLRKKPITGSPNRKTKTIIRID